MHSTRPYVLAALSTWALSIACADSRCNVANCQFMLTDCHVRLMGATDATCLESGSISASIAAGDYFLDAGAQFCVDACNADGQGALARCIADHFSGTICHDLELDGGDTFQAIEAACSPPPSCGPNCTACSQTCNDANNQCNQGCGDGGAPPPACFSCNYACNQQLVKCEAACPVN